MVGSIDSGDKNITSFGNVHEPKQPKNPKKKSGNFWKHYKPPENFMKSAFGQFLKTEQNAKKYIHTVFNDMVQNIKKIEKKERKHAKEVQRRQKRSMGG